MTDAQNQSGDTSGQPERTSAQFRIDLHVHTLNRSLCAGEYQDDMIRAAIERGLHGIAFAEHNRLTPQDELAELNAEYAPFRIYGGIEVTVGAEHVLVFGVRRAGIELENWDYPSLHRFVRDAGGYIIFAHPFRNADPIMIDLESFPPDGIEIHSHNVRPRDIPRIRELARRHHLHIFSNSDGHGVRLVGGFYNLFPALPADETELLAALKARTSAPFLAREWMKPDVAKTWFPGS